MRNLLNKLVSTTAIKIVCSLLVLAAAASAVSEGIKGNYPEMHGHINWVIWISLVVMLIIIGERRDEEIEVKDSYIKALEEYKVLTDEHIVTLKKLIEAHKTRSEGLEDQIETHKKLNVINEKIIEEYKNQKPSRF